MDSKIETLRLPAKRYEDYDNCLQAAADEVADERGLEADGLNPRWEGGEEGERETILVDVAVQRRRRRTNARH